MQTNTRWNNVSLTKRRERARSVVGIGPLWPEGHFQLLTWGCWPACYPLGPQHEGTHFLHAEDSYSSGADLVLYDTPSSTTKGWTQSLKQGTIFPHEVISPARAVWAHYLLLKECFKAQACSHAAAWGPKDCMHETAFPSVFFKEYWSLFIVGFFFFNLIQNN